VKRKASSPTVATIERPSGAQTANAVEAVAVRAPSVAVRLRRLLPSRSTVQIS